MKQWFRGDFCTHVYYFYTCNLPHHSVHSLQAGRFYDVVFETAQLGLVLLRQVRTCTMQSKECLGQARGCCWLSSFLGDGVVMVVVLAAVMLVWVLM